MIIIVEGIDRVGKTTACNELNKITNYEIFKDDFKYSSEYKDSNVNDEKGNTLVNLIEQGIIKNLILDRFHWSEYVYGIINRKYVNKNCFDIEKRLLKCKVVMILVKATDIKKSSLQHGSNLYEHEKLFEKLYERSKLTKFAINYNDIIELKKILNGVL